MLAEDRVAAAETNLTAEEKAQRVRDVREAVLSGPAVDDDNDEGDEPADRWAERADLQ